MKRLQEVNSNTKLYWNNVYQTDANRSKYAVESFGINQQSKRFARAVEEVKDKDQFLDMGCGIGLLTRMVKDAHPSAQVWGTDISDAAIRDNTKAHEDIDYLHQYIGSQTDLPDSYFDVVFCGETIEHLDDPSLAFKDAFRVLKPGGKLIITTPNENRINSEEHIWSFTQEDVETLYTENGFEKPQFVFLPDMESYLIIFAIGKKPYED